MTPTDSPQNPKECRHYAPKKKCTPGWFHGKCCLCYDGFIRCPEYKPKEKKDNGI